VSDETEPGHGHSPAAWTAVIIMLVGFTLGTLFFWFDLPILVWVSAGIVLLGLIVGIVLARMGYGAHGERYASKGH
jgi:membrane glycosyltransferase